MHPTFDTVIFDLDGTLMNTLIDLYNAVNYVLAKHQYPLKSTEEVRMALGNGVSKLMKRCLPSTITPIEHANLLAEFKAYYGEHLKDNTKPYDGIYELLDLLKEHNYKIAIVSNKLQPAVTPLAKEYFGDYLEVAIGETPEIHKKPAPDMVNEALKQLNSSKDKAVYIGDSDTDIDTAKNSNLYAISVLWGFRDKDFLIQHGATHLVSTPIEIFEFLENGYKN